MFVMLDCWKKNAPAKWLPIFNDKTCYGCLFNTATSGDMMSMTKCMTGSSAAAPNDHAYESFLYGLAVWSKTPLENAGGKNMTWNVAPRGYLSAEFDMNGSKSGVVCTHVGVEGAEQQQQFKQITKFVESREAAGVKNWIMAGDLNSGPASKDGKIAQNPLTKDTAGKASSDELIELGWWGIYNHADFKPTWDLPMNATNNFFDGNTNICGHTTGIDCNGMGENDGRKMLLDHIYIRGEAFPKSSENYNAKRIFDTKYGANAANHTEGFHISDHYGLQMQMQ